MLWENFEVIAEAENGIQRLRELILDLAARGLLVPQYSEEGKADSVLEVIKSERNSWLDSKQRKKEKKLSEVDLAEIPHKIPSSWCWTRLGEVVLFSVAEKCPSEDIPETALLLDLEDIEKDTSRLLRKKQFLDKPSKSTKAFFKSGDILYGKLRPYLNKVLVSDDSGYCTTEILPLRPFSVIIPEYVKYILKRRDFLDYANSKTYGINLPRLGTEDARQAVFPLPPTQEQKRIVKKVDELMKLCDRAEASKKNRNELQQQLRRSAIHALETAETEEDFKKSWHFVRDNFSAISQTQSDVQSLRELVLDAGMRGKLTLQDYKNESAKKLIKCIQDSKILKQKQKKRSNNRNKLLSVSPEDIPFQIPDNWKWIRLHEICWLITDGAHHTPQYVKSGVPFISVKDISKGYINFSDTKFISHETHLELCSRCHPERGDILLTKVGTTGIAVEVDTDKDFSIFVSVALLKIFPDYTYPRFVRYLLNSSLVRRQSEGGTEGIGNKNLVLRKIYNFLVVLPPLEEQKRIVSKVDELMKSCDRVEESLRKKEELASAISASVIHHLEL